MKVFALKFSAAQVVKTRRRPIFGSLSSVNPQARTLRFLLDAGGALEQA